MPRTSNARVSGVGKPPHGESGLVVAACVHQPAAGDHRLRPAARFHQRRRSESQFDIRVQQQDEVGTLRRDALVYRGGEASFACVRDQLYDRRGGVPARSVSSLEALSTTVNGETCADSRQRSIISPELYVTITTPSLSLMSRAKYSRQYRS